MTPTALIPGKRKLESEEFLEPSSTSLHILDLPNEIIERIFHSCVVEAMTFEEASNIRSVCRQFKLVFDGLNFGISPELAPEGTTPRHVFELWQRLNRTPLYDARIPAERRINPSAVGRDIAALLGEMGEIERLERARSRIIFCAHLPELKPSFLFLQRVFISRGVTASALSPSRVFNLSDQLTVAMSQPLYAKFVTTHTRLLHFPPPEMNALGNCTILDLQSSGIIALPPEIGQLTELQALLLSNNYLRTLPRELGNLVHLTHLFLDNNQLHHLPSSLSQLSRLTRLSIANNDFNHVPACICALEKLDDLNLSENAIASFPPELGLLTNLKTLDLGNNRLATLPFQFGMLTSLQTLYLSGNQLTELPVSVGWLSQLRIMGVSHNRLTSLPETVCFLENVTMLNLCKNRLSSLPNGIGRMGSLTMLDLSFNPITQLPVTLLHLRSLRKLGIGNIPGLGQNIAIMELLDALCRQLGTQLF